MFPLAYYEIKIRSDAEFAALVKLLRSGEILRVMCKNEEKYGREHALLVDVKNVVTGAPNEWCAGFERQVIVNSWFAKHPKILHTDQYSPPNRTCNFVIGTPGEYPLSWSIIPCGHGMPKSITIMFSNVLRTIYGASFVPLQYIMGSELEYLNIETVGTTDESLTAEDANRMFCPEATYRNLRTIAIHRAPRTYDVPQSFMNISRVFDHIMANPNQFPMLETLALAAVHFPRFFEIRSRTLRQIQLPGDASAVTIECPRLELVSQSSATILNLVGDTNPTTIDIYMSEPRPRLDSFENAIKNARHLLISTHVRPIRPIRPNETCRLALSHLKSLAFYEGGQPRRDPYAKFCNLRFVAPRLEEMWIGDKKYTDLPMLREGGGEAAPEYRLMPALL